ncbi:MAG: ATP-binding protein, partial [Deltaproteobacteria bacterium]|nr:ATP-binding protein [Deltaproteobacteria bacterium]
RVTDVHAYLNGHFGLSTAIYRNKIEGWEQFVVELSRNPAWKVMVTGSSSKMLRHDIATELRGKAISTVIFPLSFKEYLKFRGFRGLTGSTKGQAEARRFFDEYLKWGGYPAISHMAEHTKEVVLREYFDTMLLKDIIQRYDVGKPRQCIHLYRYLMSNISKPHTLQSAFRYLKQAGFNTSRDTLRDYFGWAEDSWLLVRVPIFSNSLKEQERNYKKIYAIDWALANLNSFTWDGSFSRAFENLVFLHLYRNWHRVHFYLTRKKRQEVDFIAVDGRGKPEMAVQVCMDISNPETFEREMNALTATAVYFKIKNNFIITNNQEQDFEKQGVQVKAIPAWKWLLL